MPAEDLGRLHLERFAKSGEVHKPDDFAFTVECKESGCKVLVPAGVTILDALIGAGVDANFDGAPDHRDSILSPQERKMATILFPCVSRANTPELVLDV